MASGATIKAIESSTVHRIQSGQVIVDLCSVAKELVENGIDAGATSIEVRFKNQGLDSIEVQDNGSGIAPENYETLALKHYTSKLASYADLARLQTFGFRGEALSSLCALSRFSVVTCTPEQAPRATRLAFAPSGRLQSTSVVSGPRGTTVCVEDLFYNLPVRRRELERNIKREWAKVVGLLHQYACVLTGVKFAVSQQPNKGRRMVLFATRGNPTTRENIINVFGVKTMNHLIPLDLRLELVPTTTTTTTTTAGQLQKRGGKTEVLVRGHVSRPVHGEGRQTPDRQMFYVNGRPCGLPQFAKVFNEVYRSYNLTQSPFVFADIHLDTALYDVNVSPDKRTILLHDQGPMLETLKESLVELFEKQEITVPMGPLAAAAAAAAHKMAKTTPARHHRAGFVSGARALGTDSSPAPSLSPSRSTSRVTRGLRGDGEEEDEFEEEDEKGHAESDEEGQGEEEGEQETDRPAAKRHQGTHKGRGVSSASISRDAGAINLLSRWVRRKSTTEDTVAPSEPPSDGDPERGTRNSSPEEEDEEDESVASQAEEDDGPTEGAGGQADADAEDVSAAAGAFDDASRDATNAAATQHDAHRQKTSREPPIPAIHPPTPSRPSLLPAASSPRRPTQQVATIRIGDHVVTSVIGPPAKRPKVDDDPPRTSLGTTKAAQRRPAAPLPSFGGRLTRMFAATSSNQEASAEFLGTTAAEEGEDEDEDEDLEGGGGGGGAVSPSPEGDVNEEHEGEEDEDEDDESSLFVSQATEPRLEDMDEDVEAGDDAGDSHVEEEDGDPEARASSVEASPASSSAGDAEQEDAIDVDGGEQREEDSTAGTAEVPRQTTEDVSRSETAAEEAQRRSQMLLKGGAKRKDGTLRLVQHLRVDEQSLRARTRRWHERLAEAARRPSRAAGGGGEDHGEDLAADDAEEKLSLKISKSDFGRMKVVGQFNLGFILAVREAQKRHGKERQHQEQGEEGGEAAEADEDDELFIIDQHASDEKYNFERLQASTVVQSQRLVQPRTLELTALEEELAMEHAEGALAANGFEVRVDATGAAAVGSRVQLVGLPLSRETTFTVADLEELLVLLGDAGGDRKTTPRPSRVRRMLAMRACRSSIMVGRALTRGQMERVVRHMGEMDKPWNCPHGRPTMRHLCGLGAAWEGRGWAEGDGFEGEKAAAPLDWGAWLAEG